MHKIFIVRSVLLTYIQISITFICNCTLIVHWWFYACAACRRRSTSCVSQFRFSKRNSVVPSWHSVAYKRLDLVLSVRLTGKLPASTSTVCSVSSCETVRCSTRALDQYTICVWRLRLGPVTSTVNQRSPHLLARHARKALPLSLECLAAFNAKPGYLYALTKILLHFIYFAINLHFIAKCLSACCTSGPIYLF